MMSSQSSGAERRKFKRIEVNFYVLYRVNAPSNVRMIVDNRETNAIGLDLSEGGISIVTNYDLPAGTLINTKFTVINESAVSDGERSRFMEIRGEVRYSFKTEAGAYRLGICFTDISADDRNFIANLIKEKA